MYECFFVTVNVAVVALLLIHEVQMLFSMHMIRSLRFVFGTVGALHPPPPPTCMAMYLNS